MGHAVDRDLLTLVQQNVNDLINDSNIIKSVLDQKIKKFASVQKQVAVLEDWQICQGTTLDEHDEVLMQHEEKFQEVDETLERLLRCRRIVNERLSMQINVLQEGLGKTDDKVGQLEQGLTAMTGKVEREVEHLKEGLTARTDQVEREVEHLKEGLTARTDMVEEKIEQLEQGLTARTDMVEHLDREVDCLKMKDFKPG